MAGTASTAAVTAQSAETASASESTTAAVTSESTVTSAQTEPPVTPQKEERTLPEAYIDIDFSPDGTMRDSRGHVTCTMPDPACGRVESTPVSFDGGTYTIPHLYVEREAGAVILTFEHLALESEVTQLLGGGFTVETFLVNGNRLSSGSTEQCMTNAGQSGGFGLSIKNGKLGFGVYTDTSYKTAAFGGKYDTENLTHLLGVYDPDAKAVRFYVNGKLVNEVDASGVFRPAQQGCHVSIVLGGDIGKGGTELHATNTRIADFKLYPIALTQEEATISYETAAAQLTGDETDYQVIYRPVEGLPKGSEGALYKNLINSYVTVHEPISAICVTPTVLQWAGGDLSALAAADERPATVIFDLALESGTLYALDRNGHQLGTLYDAIAALGSRIIPAFRVNDRLTAKALTEFIECNRIGDGFFISRDAALLYELWSASDPVRPVLDRTALTEIDVSALFLESTACGAKNVLLNASALTQEAATAMHARSMSVFVTVDGNDIATIHDAIFSGAEGIVTEDAKAVLNYYKTFTEPTLADPGLIIAHRGDHENCPDNIMRSLISAAQSGANIIECDVWLTTDGHLVLNHDAVTTGWSEVIDCKSATREKLKSLTYTGKRGQEGDELAFLDEMAAYFAEHDTDMVFFVELKDQRKEAVDMAIEIIRQYGLLDRTVFLNSNESVDSYLFHTHRVPLMRNSSTVYPRDDLQRTLALSCIDLAKLPTLYSTTWSNADEGLMRLLRHRGIPYSPWTSNSAADTDRHYSLSYNSLTTNYPHQTDKYVRSLEVSQGADSSVTVTCVYYDGTTADVTARAEFVPLSGNVSYNGGKVSGNGAYAFRLKTSLHTLTDYTYYICSQSVRR